MRPLNQDDFDRLQKVADAFHIELCLPPFKGRSNPFFHVINIKHDEIMKDDLYLILSTQGFSFFWQDEDYVEVIGA
jgi:hypothetical protein